MVYRSRKEREHLKHVEDFLIRVIDLVEESDRRLENSERPLEVMEKFFQELKNHIEGKRKNESTT